VKHAFAGFCLCALLLSSDVAFATQIPEIVVRGKEPAVRACADCHARDGVGRPGSASLAGMSVEYISDQIANYRKGLRGRVDAPNHPAALMQNVARAVDDADLRAAAEYFASLEFRPWMRVVEAEAVPTGGRPEPLGGRIVELPEDGGRGFVAYVPRGATKKGELLVTTGGGGRTMRCAQCHGDDLRGLGRVPPIAGRSPSYLARQLTDMRGGVRHGAGPDLMMAAVARLSNDDLVAIAAYTASLKP
jgi:cytochrome c553